VTIFIIQSLNAFFYAAVLFLIAAGLSLIYGVMRIVNVAHGGLYALGAYISAWAVGGAAGAALGDNFGLVGLLLLLPAGATVVAALGAVIEPTLLRPLYKRPEEYHLLLTFGLLMILEDVMKFLFGGTPLSAGTIMDRMGSIPVGPLLYPTYNLVVIGVGLAAALGLWWFIYRTRFGVILRATSQDRRMAAALGLDVSRVYVQAFAIGCFLAGLGGAVVVPSQAAVLGKALQAIRDNEVRARFVGIPVRRYRWIAFVISGLFTGLAGILWVPLNGLTTPDVLYWPFSGEMVFLTVLGGFRTFTGPIVGAVVFNYLKTYAVATTEYWQLLLGLVLVVLVMVLPRGIVGTAAHLTANLQRRP
jgi:branched-chain amino acid transport system permease protein